MEFLGFTISHYYSQLVEKTRVFIQRLPKLSLSDIRWQEWHVTIVVFPMATFIRARISWPVGRNSCAAPGVLLTLTLISIVHAPNRVISLTACTKSRNFTSKMRDSVHALRPRFFELSSSRKVLHMSQESWSVKVGVGLKSAQCSLNCVDESYHFELSR